MPQGDIISRNHFPRTDATIGTDTLRILVHTSGIASLGTVAMVTSRLVRSGNCTDARWQTDPESHGCTQVLWHKMLRTQTAWPQNRPERHQSNEASPPSLLRVLAHKAGVETRYRNSERYFCAHWTDQKFQITYFDDVSLVKSLLDAENVCMNWNRHEVTNIAIRDTGFGLTMPCLHHNSTTIVRHVDNKYTSLLRDIDIVFKRELHTIYTYPPSADWCPMDQNVLIFAYTLHGHMCMNTVSHNTVKQQHS